jgi:hypothetical protein
VHVEWERSRPGVVLLITYLADAAETCTALRRDVGKVICLLEPGVF